MCVHRLLLAGASRVDIEDAELRGVVDVPSGERHYVRRFGDVLTFMAPHLKTMGVKEDVRYEV